MTIESVTASPLSWPEGWPRASNRTRAQFGKNEFRNPGGQPGGGYKTKRELTIQDGTTRVLEELDRLGIKHGDAIISTNLELRLDGLPRSGQPAPRDPGVAVYWRRQGGAMKVMAIDRYDRVADNLGAIAATLFAMRAIDRHGGGQILERAFTGFDALPPPRTWREVLGFKRDARISLDDAERAFRSKAHLHHPDKGGSTIAMAEITEAIAAARKELGT